MSSTSSTSSTTSFSTKSPTTEKTNNGQNYTHPPSSPLQYAENPFALRSRRSRVAAKLCIVCIFLVVLGSAMRVWVYEGEGTEFVGAGGKDGFVGGGSVMRVDVMKVEYVFREGQEEGELGSNGVAEQGEGDIIYPEGNVLPGKEGDEEPVLTHVYADGKGMVQVVPGEDNDSRGGRAGMLGSMEVAWKA